MKKYNIAIVGATGLVGRTFLKVMEENKIEVNNLYLYASIRSVGTTINYLGKEYKVEAIENASFTGVDYCLFSAGASVSEKYAKKFAENGAIVIDNSSFYRMDKNCPLIIPEINIEDSKIGNLIANPNCSTIQSVLPLYYLDQEFDLKRVIYTTYQSVSGSGLKGINDLKRCISGLKNEFYPYDISKTCIPEIDSFLDNYYTKEEMKMVNETRKILHKDDLLISATCVRVPVEKSHAVSILAEFNKEITVDKARECLRNKKGIVLADDPFNHIYPLSTMSNDNDMVYVGRIRKDLSSPNGLLLYTTADNVRKGAASNAVEIMIDLMKEREMKC